MNDPAAQTFRNACREARVVVVVWLAALIWTVGYCYLNGYSHDPEGWLVRWGIADAEPAAIRQITYGMPTWVCWGILAPAVCCSIFTFLFGLLAMRDDPLGVENEEAGQ